MNERYELSCTLDEVRIRLWQGEQLDFTRRDGCYPQFMFIAPAAVALQDGEVCRRTLRRIGLLDRLSVFDSESVLQRRVEDLFARRLAEGPSRPGPERAELVRLLAEHLRIAGSGR